MGGYARGFMGVSRNLMKLFVFDLNFIGWYILTVVIAGCILLGTVGRLHDTGMAVRCSRQLWWRRYA
ncbi:MAG: hypothetical protein ACLT4C_08345 [Butyricicoccus sp.]